MTDNLRIADSRISEDFVRSVSEPGWTESWHPISHGRCIDAMETATKELGIKVQQRFYSMSKDTLKMYGAWTIGDGDTKKLGSDTLFQCILFRNSIDKSYSFGINGGTDAYICENLMVFGKFIEFRRHTSGLDSEELRRVVTKGIKKLKPRLNSIMEWHQSLRNIRLTETKTRALSYDAIREKVISQKAIPQFHDLLFGEGDKRHYEPNSLFNFHGAATELMRDMRMTGGFQSKQNRLNEFVQKRYGSQLPKIIS